MVSNVHQPEWYILRLNYERQAQNSQTLSVVDTNCRFYICGSYELYMSTASEFITLSWWTFKIAFNGERCLGPIPAVAKAIAAV